MVMIVVIHRANHISQVSLEPFHYIFPHNLLIPGVNYEQKKANVNTIAINTFFMHYPSLYASCVNEICLANFFHYMVEEWKQNVHESIHPKSIKIIFKIKFIKFIKFYIH